MKAIIIISVIGFVMILALIILACQKCRNIDQENQKQSEDTASVSNYDYKEYLTTIREVNSQEFRDSTRERSNTSASNNEQ